MKKNPGLLLLSAAGLLFSLSILNAQDAKFPAFIAKSGGEIYLQPENSALWLKAKTGAGLKSGDTLRLGPKSYAVIFIDDGSAFRVEEDSVIKIRSLLLNVSKKKCSGVIDVVKKGYMLLFAEKNYKPEIQVNTPVCTVAIRGTGLAVNVPDEKSAEIAMFEGKVIVKDFVQESGLPTNGNELLLSFLHEMSVKADQVVSVNGQGIAQPKKLKPADMADARTKLKEIKALSQELQKQDSNIKSEELQSQRSAVRDEITADNEKNK